MDHRDHPASGRSGHPAARLTPPTRFEWTRQPGTGPPASILAPLTGAAAIELGCGTGHNLAHLATRYGVTGTGIDHDPAKISQARTAYGHLPGLTFILADACRYLTATRPGSADLVVSIFGAFSFTDPLPLLTATARVLRPGGRLAITLRASDHHDTVVVLHRR
jgi:ubiquinone/menaquinone biosynthesis C-methylase UbiE